MRSSVEGISLYYTSLGCDKNLTDAEHMLYDLDQAGYVMVSDPAEARVIVINTCCFISDAMEESIDTILDLSRYRQEGKLEALIVTGCLSTRFSDLIHEELPEVDAFLTTTSYDHLTEVIGSVLSGKPEDSIESDDRLPVNRGRLLSQGGYSAYLKIAEGCNKGCSYCVIPSIRGPYRSIPMEELLNEASDLVSKGVRELILVAQETTLYGVDLYGHKSLHELVTKLSEIRSLAWIRILYAYPEEIYDELITVMAENPKVCHYLDIPIQHSSDHILSAMKRRTRHDELIESVKRLREAIPDIALRTTIITGFPGETEEDHRENLRFVREMKFDRLGCFMYSPQEGTEAAEFPDQVDPVVAQIRYDDIMIAQQDVVFAKNESLVGCEFDVIVEGALPEEESDLYVGRTYRDAPDVDGLIFFKSPFSYMSGDIVRLRVTASKDYDLIGVPYEDESTQ